MSQGKIKLATVTMGELQSAATDLLTTSKFYCHNIIQAGKANARAQFAQDDVSDGSPAARQVTDDKPCNDGMIEGIVDRLRNKRQLSQGMCKFIRRTYTCIHCFANNHHTGGCNGLRDEYVITRKRGPPKPKPDSDLPPSTSGGTAARKATLKASRDEARR
jgi:hypothetical protein